MPRYADLTSNLFDRASPAPSPTGAHAKQVAGGWMDWTIDLQLASLSPTREPTEASRWHEKQLSLERVGGSSGTPAGRPTYAIDRTVNCSHRAHDCLTSDAMMDGTRSAPRSRAVRRALAEFASTDVHAHQRRAHPWPYSDILPRPIRSFSPGAAISPGVAPDDGEREAAAARAAAATDDLAAQMWIRVDGLPQEGIESAARALTALADSASSDAPFLALRLGLNPLTGSGKGFACMAFAAESFADLTDVTHELRLRGLKVSPVSFTQVCVLLD
jgi:hypothetical protein